jgi:hypothetical protein
MSRTSPRLRPRGWMEASASTRKPWRRGASVSRCRQSDERTAGLGIRAGLGNPAGGTDGRRAGIRVACERVLPGGPAVLREKQPQESCFNRHDPNGILTRSSGRED